MNLMPALRQFHSKSGRQNATAADQGKTGDADAQRVHYSPVNALSASEMSIRGTNVTPGASPSFKYSRSPAPQT
jgi:hypothetical protein